MQTNMGLLLATPPDQCRTTLCFSLPVAHVAYRVGGGPHLFRASTLVSVRGGLMVIDDIGFDGRDEAGLFRQKVLRECMARGYDGILCDFEGYPLQVLARAVCTLGEPTKGRGQPLCVIEAHAPFSDPAVAFIPSALPGSSLQQRLQEAMECFGTARMALAAERVAEGFFLPSPTGQGMSLVREELRQRLKERALSVFLFSELCAHYSAYISRQNGVHLVLFDDIDSIRKKLQVVRNLGVSGAVLVYPWVDDSLPELLK